MANETERCVDELVAKTSQLERLVEDCKAEPHSDALRSQARLLIADLQSFIDNNKPSIPSYCLKKAIEASSKLELVIDEPLKKAKVLFKFNAQPKPSKKVEPEKKAIVEYSEKSPLEATKGNVTVFGFADRTNETLSLGMDEVRSKDISLTGLRGCQVSIYGLAGAIYISDLVDTTVTVCLAQRAVTIRNCTNCSFTLVCQQLRIDSTRDTKLQTFVSCRSMLESSKGLEFQSIDWNSLDISDEQISQLFSEAAFERSSNNWRMIDDFDNLARGGECSQNFTRVS